MPLYWTAAAYHKQSLLLVIFLIPRKIAPFPFVYICERGSTDGPTAAAKRVYPVSCGEILQNGGQNRLCIFENEGYSIKEIAEVLGKSLATIGMRLARARISRW
nr:MAG: hypothetical protein DIU64_12135 [Caldicoprobacter oshimai]